MSKPFARLATSVPISPRPMIPKVLPYTSYPRKRSGDHPDFHLPILKCLSALTIFLLQKELRKKSDLP